MPTNMIDYLRIALYATLVVILITLFQVWDKDHPKPLVSKTETVQTSNNYVPQLTEAALEKTENKTISTPDIKATVIPPAINLIHITTSNLKVNIDPVGGNIVKVELLKYPESLHSDTPFILLNDQPDTRYIAQAGLLSTSGPDTSKGQAIFTADKTDYTLLPGQNELIVNLHWQNPEGIKVTKTFTFVRDSYQINLNYQIENTSTQVWNGNLYLQLMRKNSPPPSSGGFVSMATYFGAAVSSPDKRFQKITFKDMDKLNLNQTITDGWAAMIQHYFISAWVPDPKVPNQYFSRVTNDGLYTIGSIGSKVSVNPGEKINLPAKLYTGPSIAKELEKVAPGLPLTIDFGWLWIISVAIFWMMQKIYDFVGNWGWSIVIVTVIIKLLFYHLSAKSYRSMSSLKKLQPRINSLKERFGDDKQKFTQATLELYKKEKVNPMSGCLPILIQIPVFIALYWVLIESVELRQAPFMLWIQDLSTKDPYYVLPVLMGIAMFLSQRLNPPPADPMQAKVLMFMPVLFTILFLNFPAGLMLYWFVNNTLSFLQQWYIMRSVEKAEPTKKMR